ncbi:DEAD/DEAH box helicase [Alicyclobacillus fastidiosus]|uniref:DEAD/DEAH box helicase n=1 Tax=Alicyclobacillus fastidiosus TaxID=392011 RepID=A0ABV5ACU6_9BACL|nr:DEAD/DEAH box helicase [Alicyclobacillus fastidiosus]WEH11294.1 DEAD/DEAH box helicase [Alicyclobacillus fastidiosus]
MSAQLTHGVIKSLCGQVSYTSGKNYYRLQKVTFTSYRPELDLYEAAVKTSHHPDEHCRVAVQIQDGHVLARCTCPTLDSYDNYCQHIAAVLLYLYDIEHLGVSPVRSDHPEGAASEESDPPVGPSSPSTDTRSPASVDEFQLTERILKLFTEHRPRSSRVSPLIDMRTTLDVAFTYLPVAAVDETYLFGVEIEVGVEQRHAVHNIRAFLNQMDRGEPCVVAKDFTYDPALHRVRMEDDAVLSQLIQIYRNEQLYQASSHVPSNEAIASSDQTLFIPPVVWDDVLAALANTPTVALKHGDRTFAGVHRSDGPLPLEFEFDQTPAGAYHLSVLGLEQLVVMESYGMIVSDGKLFKLNPDECQRLTLLKQMMDASHEHHIPIPEAQMEPYIQAVIPGLMKLGRVHIANPVSEKIVQTPLKARLYLDRVHDRLVGGLEFQYGDVVINPLEGRDQKQATGRMLIRDGEQERRILEVMDESGFSKTEAGYFMDEEDLQYDFLYHVLPQLEDHLTVYATSAVKERLHTGHASPTVTMDVNSRTNWLEWRFQMDGIPESEIRSLLQSLREKRKYFRLRSGALVPLESEEFQEIVRLMGDFGIHSMDIQATGIRIPIARGLHLFGANRQEKAVSLGQSLRQLLEHVQHPDRLNFPVPRGLAPILRDYQRHGYQWMKTLAHYGFGGVLADDMGLGKTLQSIAFIVSSLPEMRQQGLVTLIVCPASLVYNWKHELTKFAPEVRVGVAEGNKARRTTVLKDAEQVDVLVTSYPLLRKDVEGYVGEYHTLILDEAQAFKNPTTQTAKAVKAIRARHRFALTGTPIENHLEDLWSIFDVVFPELFPNRRAFNDLPRETVARRTRPFVLRRLKSDVLEELPEKIESLQLSQLLPEQKKLYVAYLAKLQQETVKHLSRDGYQKHRIKILSGLTRLRQLCCHPALFVEGYTGKSAKFEQLLEILEACRRAGKRVLVFSQFTEMLGLVRRELGLLGTPYFYLDGNTKAEVRVDLCDRFNQGEVDLFLVSLKAGGTGLNLPGADTVILYDLWWNPAVEQQAADRAHRMGQKNAVQVIRLVSQGTVEEKMYQLQQKKINLIDEVVNPGQAAITPLTERDIRDILLLE